MKAKTAVEWLYKELYETPRTLWEDQLIEIFKQAMEMEEDQIKEAFQLGELNENSFQHVGKRIHKDKEEYYNKSYKK